MINCRGLKTIAFEKFASANSAIYLSKPELDISANFGL